MSTTLSLSGRDSSWTRPAIGAAICQCVCVSFLLCFYFGFRVPSTLPLPSPLAAGVKAGHTRTSLATEPRRCIFLLFNWLDLYLNVRLNRTSRLFTAFENKIINYEKFRNWQKSESLHFNSFQPNNVIGRFEIVAVDT